MRDVRLPGLGGHLPAVDQEPARRRFEKTHHDVGQRALATAGGADKGDAFAPFDHEAHVAKHERQVGLIAEGNVVEREAVVERCRHDGWRIDGWGGLIEQSESCLKVARAGPDQRCRGIRLLHGRQQPLGTKCQGAKHGQCRHEPARLTDQQKRQDRDPGHRHSLDQKPGKPAEKLRLGLESADAPVVGAETVYVILLRLVEEHVANAPKPLVNGLRHG